MTTVELRKIENRLLFQVDPSNYSAEENEVIDQVLETARNIQELSVILDH